MVYRMVYKKAYREIKINYKYINTNGCQVYIGMSSIYCFFICFVTNYK